jgi:hypothetical protein
MVAALSGKENYAKLVLRMKEEQAQQGKIGPSQ